MKEAYVKFGTAKRLKEKGFDWECRTYLYTINVYNYGIEPCRFQINDTKNSELASDKMTAPTQQMACDWVEKTYGFFIEVSRHIDINGNYHYFYMILDKACRYASEAAKDNDYPSKSDAVEAALEYVLTKLI